MLRLSRGELRRLNASPTNILLLLQIGQQVVGHWLSRSERQFSRVSFQFIDGSLIRITSIYLVAVAVMSYDIIRHSVVSEFWSSRRAR